MAITFMATGYGIRQGAVLERMSTVDLAPTVAALLGLEMKNVEGRVLTEILATERLK